MRSIRQKMYIWKNSREGWVGWGCAQELITTEERAHHACAKIHKPQGVRTSISPLSLHFHVVQFRSAGEKHAFFQKNGYS